MTGHFRPRVGIVYQPVSNTALFASYSNNFTPNTGRDVFNQNLAPSIIDHYEIGIKNDLFNDKLSANFTIYRIVNNNLAQQAQFLADGVTINTDASIKELTGQTTSDGAEIDLNGNIIEGLNFLAGYSYNFMRYTKTVGRSFGAGSISGQGQIGTGNKLIRIQDVNRVVNAALAQRSYVKSVRGI